MSERGDPPQGGSGTAGQCSHHYVYLRQSKRTTGSDRALECTIFDVFYCNRCLKYMTKDVERQRINEDYTLKFESLI